MDSPFYPACWVVGSYLGLPPSTAGYNIGGLLYSESSVTPTAINSIGCGGLNGFCPGSLPSGITMSAFRGLSASEQLTKWIGPWWLRRVKQYGGIDDIGDLYWLNYWPATYKRGQSDSAIVNPHVAALDAALAHGKTYVTKGDMIQFLSGRCRGHRWDAIALNLASYAVPGPTLPMLGAAVAGAAALGVWWYVLTK